MALYIALAIFGVLQFTERQRIWRMTRTLECFSRGQAQSPIPLDAQLNTKCSTSVQRLTCYPGTKRKIRVNSSRSTQVDAVVSRDSASRGIHEVWQPATILLGRVTPPVTVEGAATVRLAEGKHGAIPPAIGSRSQFQSIRRTGLP